ncbi:MAG: HAD family hydrolase [Candidatus Limnocylindrales bacterium]
MVVFDKDGTLIDFHAMWSGWVEGLADELEEASGLPLRRPLFAMMGYDPGSHRAYPGGGLISTPMARLRESTAEVLATEGLAAGRIETVLGAAWRAPDPVSLAHPLTDLEALLGGLRTAGRRVAVATSDDREPTLRTLRALDIEGLVDAVVCADDGPAVKPAGAAIEHLCATLGVPADRSAVVGDAPADLAMGRAAGAALVIGVLSGVGSRDDLAGADLLIESVADLHA